MMRALVYGIPIAETQDGASFYRRMPDGEGSLSGARFTHDGLAERIRTIRKIAHLLEERGRVRPYRAALSTSFRRLANDADGRHPELFRRAEAYAKRYAPPRWATAASRAVHLAEHGARRIFTALHRHWRAIRQPDQRTAARRADREEVRYGLDQATHLLEAAADLPLAPLERRHRPLVSVVIPTYNRATLLARALDSALAQTLSDFEVLVVDDGSTDETEAVVRGCGDDRVRYLRQPTNQGVSAARNRGLQEARGPFIAFLDSDDVWFPHKLDAQVTRFRELPEDVGLLYGGVENEYDQGQRELQMPSHRGDLYATLLVRNVIHGTSGVMIRRDVVTTVGFFDEEIPAIEDYDYWLRASRFFEVDYIEEPLIRYYDPRNIERKSLDVEDNLEARDYLFEKHVRQMRSEGTAHLYLQKSIGRALTLDPNNRSLARKLARRALRYQPFSYESYRRLAALTVPPRLFQGLRTVFGPVRQLRKASADPP